MPNEMNKLRRQKSNKRFDVINIVTSSPSTIQKDSSFALTLHNHQYLTLKCFRFNMNYFINVK